VKVFDCFAGCGGFRLAFEREGFKSVGFCEIDKYASQLYRAYYNTDGEIYYNDATKIDPGSMPDFDIFCGGFPCQAFSVAGKRQGFKDTRGTLFFEIARICDDKKPKYIVLENVKGILSHDNRRTFATIIGILSDIGYAVEWQVLNSKYFGVPQNRERVFIVGHFGERSTGKIFPIRKDEKVYSKSDENKEKVHNIASTTNAIQITKNQSQGMRVYDSHGIAITQSSLGGGGGAKTGLYLIDNKIRRLTPLESFRLQGFPDDIVQKAYEIGIEDKYLQKIAGNSVTVNVVQEIARRIKLLEN